MNIWTFTGHLGKDIEVRYLPNGDAVGSFSVGVNFGYGDKKGTIWARCSLFGKRVEALRQYLNKGQLVAVSGEVSERKWQDKEGTERVSQEVRVNDVTLLGGKSETPAKAAPNKSVSLDDDDSIPF